MCYANMTVFRPNTVADPSSHFTVGKVGCILLDRLGKKGELLKKEENAPCVVGWTTTSSSSANPVVVFPVIVEAADGRQLN